MKKHGKPTVNVDHSLNGNHWLSTCFLFTLVPKLTPSYGRSLCCWTSLGLRKEIVIQHLKALLYVSRPQKRNIFMYSNSSTIHIICPLCCLVILPPTTQWPTSRSPGFSWRTAPRLFGEEELSSSSEDASQEAA